MFNIPNFTQGDRVTWNLSNEGYDLNNTLACFIRGVAGSLDLTATINGALWEFIIESSQSQDLIQGEYQAQFVLFNGTNRVTLGLQKFQVFPALDLAGDLRSKDEIELEKLAQAIASMLENGGVAEYYIGERRVRYSSLEELYKERDRLRRRVAMAKNKAMIGGRNVKGSYGC